MLGFSGPSEHENRPTTFPGLVSEAEAVTKRKFEQLRCVRGITLYFPPLPAGPLPS